MDEPTQAPEAGLPPDAGSEPSDAAAIQRGLLRWLLVVGAGGLASLLLGHPEGGILFAAAGAFALAQASDAAAALRRYRSFVHDRFPHDSARGVLSRIVVRALVPLAGALFFAGFGLAAWNGGEGHPSRFATAWCAGAVVVCLSLSARPVADAVMRLLFRGTPGRTRRLTARLVVMAAMVPVPGVAVAPRILAAMRDSGGSLVDAQGLLAQLIGEVAVALAGVGWRVRRGGRETLERLGLTALRPAHAGVALLGLLALLALNTGGDWLEQHAFPAMWAHDREATRLIAGHLSLASALLLGVSAGSGEELMIRGALQPRLGIVLSALVFASGHVQYSWFGMGTIAVLGATLGLVRARANTTTAILVHAVFDVYAVLVANR